MPEKDLHEFRKDLVSGDWILIASGRRKRPEILKDQPSSKTATTPVAVCPFDDPQASGNPAPILWHPRPGTPVDKRDDFSSWFVQVVPNKYPLLAPRKNCPMLQKKNIAEYQLDAVGYHEVIITRDHLRSFADMDIDEVDLVIKVYYERFKSLMSDPCVKYILVYHNQGERAGASVDHPHSQLVALPVIDPDIASSLSGSLHFYTLNRFCVHCVMLKHELKKKVRIVQKNKYFVSLAPYAPRVSYEIRIFPLKHSARFELLTEEERPYLAEILRDSLRRLKLALNNPDYNFFLHSSPVNELDTSHYHWHIEILPQGFRWAGVELGGGIEVVAVPPEEAAEVLRKQGV